MKRGWIEIDMKTRHSNTERPTAMKVMGKLFGKVAQVNSGTGTRQVRGNYMDEWDSSAA